MVKTGLSEVIGSWNTMAMPGPRIRCMRVSENLVRFSPANRTLPAATRAAAAAAAHDGERGHALAGARLAHDPQDLALMQRERYVLDRLDLAARRGESCRQVGDVEQAHSAPEKIPHGDHGGSTENHGAGRMRARRATEFLICVTLRGSLCSPCETFLFTAAPSTADPEHPAAHPPASSAQAP